ncbi:MAG: HNH endonuclease [Hyphomicrobiales bacterium]|nr:HNH endonuclease [Hyphomicrobiales bacterium]
MARTYASEALDRRIIGDLPNKRSDAIALGIKHYFTGKPCKRGHLAKRQSESGVCVECNYSRGLAWRRDRPGFSAESDKAWRDANRGKVRKYKLESYYNNRESYRERFRAYYVENKSEMNEASRKWRVDNPDKALANHHKRRARKERAAGSHSHLDVERIRKSQRDRCACCRSSLKGGGHVDHIIALSKGGSNWARNLQLLCQPCNNSKHNRDPVEFMQSRGFLI